MTDREVLENKLTELIKKYEEMDSHEKKALSEANVRKDFINELFLVLGWKINDSSEYDSEYRIGSGYVDIAIKDPRSNPIILIEAKRFSKIDSYFDKVIETSLKGKPIVADWTEEERQLIRYVDGALEAKCAILTNFEKFRVYNARTADVIFNIENPREYFEYIDELLKLSRKEVVERNNLDSLLKVKKRSDIDLDFLNLIQKWRLLLANNVIQKLDLPLENINFLIQRVLDRFIVIRYAEDRYVIEGEQLEAIHNLYKLVSYINLNNTVNEFFSGFNKIHNSKIFEKNQEIDEFVNIIDEEILDTIIEGLYYCNFKKLDPHILGNTYETYLGTKLVLDGEEVKIKPIDDSKKEDGIVYTPSHIVKYMAIKTVGDLLENLWNKVKDLFDKEDFLSAVSEFKNIYNIKILDPACGSGSFLIQVHELFENCYKKYEQEVTIASKKLEMLVESEKIEYWEAKKIEVEMIKVFKKNNKSIYEKRILKNNIYGVDLDQPAAEIASVNLMLKAIKPEEKLPLILDENIKVGNSIITGVDNKEELLEHSEQIKDLIKCREQIKLASSKEKKILETQFNKIKVQLNNELNKNLLDYFNDLNPIEPFNYEIEFPEVFFDKEGKLLENGGFDVIIGNPPYKSTSRIKKSERVYYNKFYETIGKEMNYFSLFIERFMKLMKNEAFFSFIVPDSLLTVTSYQKLRKLILDTASIYNITNVPGGAFEDVEVGNSTIIMFKNVYDDSKIVKTFNYIKNHNEWLFKKEDEIEQSRYYQTPENIFYLNNWSIDFTTERFISGYKNLDELADLRDGIKTGDNGKFVSSNKSTSQHQKLLTGSDILRYSFRYNDLYVLYDPKLLSGAREEEIFLSDEKIITRQTGDRIIATYDNEQFYTLDNTHLILRKNENYEIKYLLALINSKLINYYYRLLVPEKGRTYAQVRIEKLNILPIRLLKKQEQKVIIKIVDKILFLNKVKKDILNTFSILLNNTGQNNSFKSLSYYITLQNAPNYSIKVVNNEELIEKDKIGLPTKFSVCKSGQHIILTVYYEKDVENVMKIYFEDPVIMEYFYLSIYSQVNKPKRYQKESEILERVLKDIKIPKGHKYKENDVKNIKSIMNAFQEQIAQFSVEYLEKTGNNLVDLKTVNHDIEKTDKEIDKIVYKLYGLNKEEIRIIEDSY